MTSSDHKILLRLPAGASSYNQEKAGEEGGKLKPLMAKGLLLCSSFTPMVRERNEVVGRGDGITTPDGGILVLSLGLGMGVEGPPILAPGGRVLPCRCLLLSGG